MAFLVGVAVARVQLDTPTQCVQRLSRRSRTCNARRSPS